MFLESTADAGELSLRLAVVRCNVTACWAGSAGILRRYRNERPAGPLDLVIQLPAEFRPALIEDALVQAGLGLNVFARLFGIAGR